MKSTMTDQELIEVTKGFTPYAKTPITPRHFTPDMLAAMRAIADAALVKFATESPLRPANMRDEFAGRAMQAAATKPTGAEGFTFEERAAWAYMQADAMLAERIKAK